MSVQTGICYFDGRKVSQREIAFLLQGLETRGPDFTGIKTSEHMGFGFSGLLITPEDQQNQPLTGNSGSVMTFDGRLDNRDELAGLIGVKPRTSVSDVSLVLEAYERLGASCFDRVIGEYACVVCDRRLESLFLVRSQCGTRPLFYTATPQRVVWSSELDDLVVKSEVEIVVNEHYAIGYLYYQPDIDESPFRGVAVVRPGTYVRITRDGAISPAVPIWHPDRIETLILNSDAEYEEACREQLKRAVASRLRARGSVFSEMSGGLDSSTVVLLADQVLNEELRDPGTLRTISCTYQRSSSCDETFFISMVEKARGREGIRVLEEDQRVSLGLDDITFTGVPNTHHCFPGRFATVAAAMERSASRVLLTGNGGDELFWSNYAGSPELADLLCDGHILGMFSEACRWSQDAGLPLWRVLLTNAIGPITIAHRPFGWHPAEANATNRVMTEEARRWFMGSGRILGLAVTLNLRPPSRLSRVHSMRTATATIAAGYFNEYHSIFFSHPYMHQQLVDFILSLPMNQIARPGQERSLMRRAMKGILPEKIRTRRSKGSVDETFCRTFAHDYRKIGNINSLEVVQRRYADPNRLLEAIRLGSLGRTEHAGILLRMLSMERWLRSLKAITSRRLILTSALDQSVVPGLVTSCSG